MKKRIWMMMALLLIVAGVNAQKIDQRLTGLVEKVSSRRAQGQRPIDAKAVNKSIAVRFNADGTIRSLSAIGLLKEGAECPTAQLEQQGIEIRYQLGNMVVMNIPPDKLQLLDGIEEFYSVRADEIKKMMNSLSRQETQANKVTDATLAAAAGLPQAYTGNGVVLGIIDRGIDFNHAAFRNADGSTRVKRAVVFKENVGKVYETEAEIKALTTDDTTSSHGTHTSATAGGSEVGNGMQGVAPEADLILCGLENYASASNIADCINFIFDYATSVNKPAVVSISLGSIIGFHDGSDIVAQAINHLTKNGTKQGRAVVVSTANSAANWESIITYPGTTCKTVLGAAKVPQTAAEAVTYTGQYFFYASDYKDFTLELKLVNVMTGEVMPLGDHVKNVSDGTTCNLKIETGTLPTLTGGNAFYGYLDVSDGVKLDNNNYRLAIFTTPSYDSQMIKMMCEGDDYNEPCFDAPNVTGGYNFAGNGYTKGCGEFAFSTSICNDAAISVGAYITRTNWTNYLDNIYSYMPSQLTGENQELGEIADFSSYGVDDNGIARPTVIAPGMGLVSAANNWDQEHFVSGQPGQPKEEDVVLISNKEQNGRNNWYYLTQGTSMSCPHTAGIVALWMQANKELTVNEIKKIMEATCVNDEFTTNEAMIPSHNKVQAGFGKIDCLEGLKKILNTTGIETIEAGGHREATPSTMYSVDAPVYNMMGQRVNKSQKGLVIYKGRKYVNK